MRLKLTASYEYDVTPGEGSYADCVTAAECIAVDREFADELILDAITNGEPEDVGFTLTEVKAK